jgi:hypothetical protein
MLREVDPGKYCTSILSIMLREICGNRKFQVSVAFLLCPVMLIAVFSFMYPRIVIKAR